MPRTNLPHPEEPLDKVRLEGRIAGRQTAPSPGARRVEITIGSEDGGVRLDRALQRQLPELSRTLNVAAKKNECARLDTTK